MKIPCSGISCSGVATIPALKEDTKVTITFTALKGNLKLVSTRTIFVTANNETQKSPLLEKVSQTKEIINTLTTAEK